jgi:cyclophilin family peptidyl-prolyl cis-trans isomerase
MYWKAMNVGDAGRPLPECYHRPRGGTGRAAYVAVLCAIIASACASAPPAPATPTVPVITWEQKLAWMMRLEDQRILRDPNPPPPLILRAATKTQPQIVAPPPPSDLTRLLTDDEGRVRRRAALAIGRVGLADGVEPLARVLAGDQEVEVRQMAAFALGLIADPSARPALLAALKDTEPIVAGRAAEALGQIGDRRDAEAVSAMVRTQLDAGVLNGIDPDDVTYPLAPGVEAARLGIYALVRLGSYEALAATVLDAQGQPRSRWWPVAYALQRIGDRRAAPALTALVSTPGNYTAAFAVKGLGTLKSTESAGMLRQIVEQKTSPRAILVEALRALAAINDRASIPMLTKMVADVEGDPTLRLEAMTALAAVVTADNLDLLLDLTSDTAPAIRSAAFRALARVSPESFLSTLAGLDPDRDWTVRAAQATALGMLPADLSSARLMLMLDDRDQRVVPAVLNALVASRAPDVDRILLQRLRADDFMVRATAASALGERKNPAAVPALIDAYRLAVTDSTYVARGAMLEALNTIAPAEARPLLIEALRDRDWALRLRAAMLLKEQGYTEPTADAIRPSTAGRAVDDPAWLALGSPQFSPHAFIDTDKGTIEIELAIQDAPLTVDNFITLARKGFFNGVPIHRVVPDFVVQDGDPRGDGEGGPGYTIRDEINERPYLRGTVGMALDGKDTGGSQFFITHSPQPHLDGRYTAFGSVVNGIDVVDRLVQWDVIRRVRFWDGVTASQ